MRVEVRNRIELPDSYRVQRALGMFNVWTELVTEVSFDAEVPLEREGWRIGVVVGPSGSGKTSIGRALTDLGWFEWGTEEWPEGAIVDAIAPGGDFDAVTGVLASVGLGTVPSWLRPYRVLSNGERYRAELARLLAEDHTQVWFDEFTSVLDRNVAQVGAGAFAKAWRRGPERQVVLMTPHEDILPWLSPDWVVRTSLEGVATTTDDWADGKSAISPRSAFEAAAIGTVTA
jgi:ABC-type iron transport system FetAB ATPase subunit